MKEREKCKKQAITDLNAPCGSRDIPFENQEFGQDEHCHFVSFQAHFHINITPQMQYCKTIKKSKLFDLFEAFQAIRTWQRNFA